MYRNMSGSIAHRSTPHSASNSYLCCRRTPRLQAVLCFARISPTQLPLIVMSQISSFILCAAWFLSLLTLLAFFWEVLLRPISGGSSRLRQNGATALSRLLPLLSIICAPFEKQISACWGKREDCKCGWDKRGRCAHRLPLGPGRPGNNDTCSLTPPFRQKDFASLLFDRWQGIISILQALPGSRCADVSLIFR